MSTYRTGKYDYNALCDVCGWKFKASQLRKRWDGFMVCEADWEPRNILDFYRTRKDAHLLPFTRPDDTGENRTTWTPIITDPPTGSYTASGTYIYNPLNNLYTARIVITPTNGSVTFSAATILTGPVLPFTATTVTGLGGTMIGSTTGLKYCNIQVVGTIGTVTVDSVLLLGGSPLTITEKVLILFSATVV